ncbi:NAD(P)H-binding protein [Frigoribacterium sp. VKM Ac-2836]|uniref:NAD(P)-dependent oxidoreductase n=1 Tax=Frigoribacterium sp. VKM Ac-2836 TaxID=2739014 RepID=UPI00156371C7|nr:NAD(P)H-binding protein [Frigoribacterium sp. VKM Ac-2836]
MTHDAAPLAAAGPQRLLVLGANGPTGREVVQQALNRGHRVDALTRHPESFPLHRQRLRVVAGDATDPAVIDTAVAATDSVICTIGAAFTLKPVEVYSATTRSVIAAMENHHRRRLIVVTSAGVRRSHHQSGIAQVVAYGLMRHVLGRTVYDDMAKMESLITASTLDWTIVHPPGLVSIPGHSYAVAADEIEGNLCARDDLARLLIDQLTDDRFLRGIAAVATPGLSISAGHMIRHEILKR